MKIFYAKHHDTPYNQKYWQSLNLVIWLQTGCLKMLAKLKSGGRPSLCGQVHDMQKYWRDLIWRFKLQPPNLIPRQYFWIYSILQNKNASLSILRLKLQVVTKTRHGMEQNELFHPVLFQVLCPEAI